MKVRISVTATDVENGFRDDACNCPVSLAIRRRLKTNVTTLIGGSGVSLLGPTMDLVKACDLPLRVCHAIDRFDETGDMRPTSFELDIPKRYLRRAR